MTVQDWLGADNALGIDIWEKKYRLNRESFDDWLDRVSGGSEILKKLIIQKKFLFGGRILANRGLNSSGTKITYSNCYVTGVHDSIESIYDTCKNLARTYSYGGGVGLDISNLAPRGAKVNNAANSTSGAVSFMDTFAKVTDTIGQNGRRGALMLSIGCDHPDLEEFIHIKEDVNRITSANISVRVSDDFMDAVQRDLDWTLSFSRPETGETIQKTVRAKELFHSLAKANWDMGEPGILFWDRIERWNLLSNTESFSYGGVNPCAEEPLPVGGSCLLGSINLAAFVDDNGNFDFDNLSDTVFYAVHFLNEVLEEGLPLHPLEEQRKSVANWRQIGLGVMGIADMLIKMGIRYGSNDSTALCREIARVILNNAMLSSANRALTKGYYEHFNYGEVSSTRFYIDNIDEYVDDTVKQYGIRNSQLLTIAPTGSLSTMLGISGGIEPIFANSYQRKTQSLYGEDVFYTVYTPIVKEYMEAHGITDEKDLPDYFVCSKDIPYMNRIDMQATWQNWIDASISSTVNLPESATVEDVEELYMYAWKRGLKGITIFRDGCKRAGVLTSPSKEEKSVTKADEPIPRGYIIDASDNLVGKKRKLTTGCGSLHCSAFFDPISGELLETFLDKGSSGGCNNSLVGLSRMISIAARAGCSIDAIVDQLNSCGVCPSYAVRRATKKDTSSGSCCPVAVGRALQDMYEEMQQDIGRDEPLEEQEEAHVPIEIEAQSKLKCPECGDYLYHEGGCNICKSCGWTKCE